MSYISLYRKWRPRVFSDVKGQEAVVETLKNQIKSGRNGHAYLFTGTRGTGKTSVAKILATALNCESPVDGDPCCKCPSCISIIAGDNLNVREIDAASNNGVDSVREIREDVMYPPAGSKYKVYIIDEVHMLSTGAFNALLKTLEEPPEYVIFILATTEANKVPETILSRCQRYDFHRIGLDIIYEQLKDLSSKEGLDIADDALRYIARKADGAMRDALSLLDRCGALYSGEQLSYDKVLKILGAVDTEVFSKMFNAIIESNTLESIEILNDVIVDGGAVSRFVVDFVGYLRNLLLLSAASDKDLTDLLDSSTENIAKMKEDASHTDPETLIIFIRELSELMSNLRKTSRQRTLAEVVFIRLSNYEAFSKKEVKAEAKVISSDESATIKALRRDLDTALRRIENISVNANKVINKEKVVEEKIEIIPIDPTKIPEETKKVVRQWSQIANAFIAKEGAMLTPILEAKLEGLENGHKIRIVLKSEMSAILLDSPSTSDPTKTMKESLEGYIYELTGGARIPLEISWKEKSNDGIRDLKDIIIGIPIENDDSEDEV